MVAILADRDEGDVLKVRQVITTATVGVRDKDGNPVLDPNQVYRMSRNPKTFFDPDGAHEVEVWTVTPITDMEMQSQIARNRVQKAEDYLDRHNVDHGPGGRFVRERPQVREAWMDQLDEAAKETQAPAKPKLKPQVVQQVQQVQQVQHVQQVQEVQSVQRTDRPKLRPKLKGPEIRTSGPKVKGLSLRSQVELSDALVGLDRPDPGFEAGGQYAIYDSYAIHDLLHTSPDDPFDDLQELMLSASARQRLAKDQVNGGQASRMSDLTVSDHVTFHANEDTQHVRLLDAPISADQIRHKLERQFETKPWLQQVQIEEVPGGQGFMLFGHSEPLPDVHVVEVDPTTLLNAPTMLVNDGSMRSTNITVTPLTMMVSLGDGDLEEVPFAYRATRARHHRWRVINDPDWPTTRHNDDQRG